MTQEITTEDYLAMVKTGCRKAARRIKEPHGDQGPGTYPSLYMLLANDPDIPGPIVPEWRFAAEIGRQYRADYAMPLIRLAIEIDGGIWGRQKGDGKFHHGTGSGIYADQEKTNTYAVLRWHLIRIIPEDIETGYAVSLVRAFVLGLNPPQRTRKAKRVRSRRK